MTTLNEYIGMEGSLQMLAALAWRYRADMHVHRLARGVCYGSRYGEPGADRRARVERIVDELHRRFVYAPDPINETVGLISSMLSDVVNCPTTGDVDDACLFVASLAMSVGIPCRFIAARYHKRSWTLRVAYEDEEGLWTVVDVLRQRTELFENLVFEELMFGPVPG